MQLALQARRMKRHQSKMWRMVAEMRRRQIIEANMVRMLMKSLNIRLRRVETYAVK